MQPPSSVFQSAGHAPPRRPDSLRRTASIDMTWPEGREGVMALDGRARDLFTPADGAEPLVLASDAVTARLSPDRTIEALSTQPPRSQAAQLVGARGGGGLRRALDASLPEERRRGSPLYLLLDDLAGTSLVGPWVWSRWSKDGWQGAAVPQGRAEVQAWRQATFEGVCTGFRPGSRALADLDNQGQAVQQVPPLPNPQDPAGWHAMPQTTDTSMRRARRIDVWEDELIHVDTMFQDSGTQPEGGRVAVHEYTVRLTVDPQTLRILTLQPQPRVLPYPECPSAVENVQRLVGQPLAGLRTAVLETLPRTLGCTHLNDVLRALADVPMLLAALRGQRCPAD